MAKKPPPTIDSLVDRLKAEDQAKLDYIFDDVRPRIPPPPDVTKAVPVPWSTAARRAPAGPPPRPTRKETVAQLAAEAKKAGEVRAARELAKAETTGTTGVPTEEVGPTFAVGQAITYAGLRGTVQEIRESTGILIVVLENGARAYVPVGEVRAA